MKRTIDETIIQSKIEELEMAADAETAVDTEILWTRLNKKIHERPEKKIPIIFYRAAAAVLVIATLVFAIEAIEKNKSHSNISTANVISSQPTIIAPDKPVNKKPHQQHLTAVHNKTKPDAIKPRHHLHLYTGYMSVAGSIPCNSCNALYNAGNYAHMGEYATPVLITTYNTTANEKYLICY